MSAFLETSQLTKIYDTPQGPAIIVQDFDLKIAKGEFVCIIGHSGCGKTTVLSMVAGLNQITSGVIVLAGKEVTGPGPDRGVVFPVPLSFAMAHGLRERDARGGSGVLHREPRRAPRYR
jgi:ABC-type Fe3+/spermidine/putrescine transport system ATPase subunit